MILEKKRHGGKSLQTIMPRDETYSVWDFRAALRFEDYSIISEEKEFISVVLNASIVFVRD